MRRGRGGDWSGGASDNPAGPEDGGDRPPDDVDVVTAGNTGDHYDPADARGDADHDSPFHDDREAPDGPAPHSHPETLTAMAIGSDSMRRGRDPEFQGIENYAVGKSLLRQGSLDR
ncbi:hypothetical protein [Amycolatopsis sp. lyj-112]|uniref:hypothetical protein n=1 Tax=Amycolatopsis sp. lyj-112 TaxID=2789288 RepID=UPI00397BCBDA